MGEKGTVCVTGAGGYIASWLVKLLLSTGYKVHGTVRDPNDEKNAHLRKMEASERLQLFKANLLDYDSLLPAIVGCGGVFHTASPLPLDKVPNPEIDLIAPAVRGTLNVLKACSAAKVQRVVFMSSIGSSFMIPNWPSDKIMDENCWSDKEYCKKTEETEFAYYALQTVDVRDVADALLMLYEKHEAAGRYICTAHSMNMVDLDAKLKDVYPSYKFPETIKELTEEKAHASSEKLKEMGWKPRTLEETLVDTIEFFRKDGLLE